MQHSMGKTRKFHACFYAFHPLTNEHITSYRFYQQPRLRGGCILVVRNLPTGQWLRSASF